MALEAGKPTDGYDQRPYVQSGRADLPADEACALIRRLVEAAVAGDHAALESHPAFQAMVPEIERRAASSAVQVDFRVQFSDGECVATRSVWRQTAEGEIYGVDATGKELEFEVMMVHRIEDGCVVDGREFADIQTIRQQLGIQE